MAAIAHLYGCVGLDLRAARGVLRVEVAEHALAQHDGTTQWVWHWDNLAAACIHIGLRPGAILKLLQATREIFKMKLMWHRIRNTG
jgi:hypothetical protein